MKSALALAAACVLLLTAGCSSDESSGSGGATPDGGGRVCTPPCEGHEECIAGLCVPKACTSDDDCGPAYRCGASGRCDLPACPPGCEQCSPSDGRCLDEPEPTGCHGDADCDVGEVCDQGSGRCLGGDCRGDDDCLPDQFCHPAGVCVAGCSDDAGCPDGWSCDLGTHQCVGDPCEGDDDCEEGEICLGTPKGDRCVAGCREGSCPDGLVCDTDTHLCVGAACDTDEDCPWSQRCTEQGCQTGCRGDDWCPGGRMCVDGRCVQAPCLGDEGCPVGEYCDEESGRCLMGCRDQVDCEPWETCSPEHRCVGAECTGHEDCPEGTVCDPVGSRCRPGCRDDQGCGIQVCDVATLTCRACEGDADCPDGEFCDQERGGCLVGCRVDPDDCGEGWRCLETVRVCVEEAAGPCEGDSDCPEDRFCDPGTGVCSLGCREGGCGDLARCDPVTRGCEPLACEGDSDCPAGAYCRSERCEPGCRLDGSDCPEDMPCDPDTRVCGCWDDQDCPEGDICAMSRCVQGCRGDQDCPDGWVCDLGHCLEGCRDDVLEPDDHPFEASDLAPGDLLEGLVVCPGDRDWFRIVAQPFDSISASLSFEPGAGDLDLELWCDDDLLLASRTDGPGESIEADLPVCRESFLVVAGRAGAGNPAYTLGLDVTPYACGPDGFEPDDGPARAAVVQPGDHLEATLCRGDQDWYGLRLFPGGDLVVTLEGQGELELYAGGRAVAWGEREGGRVVLSHHVVLDELFLVRVWADRVVGDGAYSLDIALEGGGACPDDQAEDDDGPLAAVSMPQDPEPRYLCPGDPDWFGVTVDERSRVTVAVETSPLVGLRVNLWPMGADEPAETWVVPRGEARSQDLTLPPGLHHLEVLAAGGDAGPYTISASVEPILCRADGLEPNDDPESAVPVEGEVPGLTICRGDEDWFAVDVPDRGDLEVLALFPVAEGDLDVDLLDATGALVARGDSEDDDERLVARDLRGGRYYVRVYGFGAQVSNVAYSLVVRVTEPGAGCPLDPNEPNDSPEEATSLQAAADGLWGFLCSPDEDWFRLETQGPGWVRIEFYHYFGDLDLELYGPEPLEVVARSDSTSSRNWEEVDVPGAGTWLVRVYGLGGAKNGYVLTEGDR